MTFGRSVKTTDDENKTIVPWSWSLRDWVTITETLIKWLGPWRTAYFIPKTLIKWLMSVFKISFSWIITEWVKLSWVSVTNHRSEKAIISIAHLFQVKLPNITNKRDALLAYYQTVLLDNRWGCFETKLHEEYTVKHRAFI